MYPGNAFEARLAGAERHDDVVLPRKRVAHLHPDGTGAPGVPGSGLLGSLELFCHRAASVVGVAELVARWQLLLRWAWATTAVDQRQAVVVGEVVVEGLVRKVILLLVHDPLVHTTHHDKVKSRLGVMSSNLFCDQGSCCSANATKLICVSCLLILTNCLWTQRESWR